MKDTLIKTYWEEILWLVIIIYTNWTSVNNTNVYNTNVFTNENKDGGIDKGWMIQKKYGTEKRYPNFVYKIIRTPMSIKGVPLYQKGSF